MPVITSLYRSTCGNKSLHCSKCQMGLSMSSPMGLSHLGILCKIIISWLIMERKNGPVFLEAPVLEPQGKKWLGMLEMPEPFLVPVHPWQETEMSFGMKHIQTLFTCDNCKDMLLLMLAQLCCSKYHLFVFFGIKACGIYIYIYLKKTCAITSITTRGRPFQVNGSGKGETKTLQALHFSKPGGLVTENRKANKTCKTYLNIQDKLEQRDRKHWRRWRQSHRQVKPIRA